MEKLKIFNKVKIIQGVALDQKFLNKIIKNYNSENLFGIIGIGDNIKRKKISLKIKKSQLIL